ncbi:hypothetical protein [Amycolatopsis sacchari]|uniref:hypothetical protein n=1 Tax=Amycolatopsis sacchari TaxID=115433 RepID=UPI003EBC1513
MTDEGDFPLPGGRSEANRTTVGLRRPAPEPADEPDGFSAFGEPARATRSGGYPAEGRATRSGNFPAVGGSPGEGRTTRSGSFPPVGGSPGDGRATRSGAFPVVDGTPGEGRGARSGNFPAVDGTKGRATRSGNYPAVGGTPTEGRATRSGNYPAVNDSRAEGRSTRSGSFRAAGEGRATRSGNHPAVAEGRSTSTGGFRTREGRATSTGSHRPVRATDTGENRTTTTGSHRAVSEGRSTTTGSHRVVSEGRGSATGTHRAMGKVAGRRKVAKWPIVAGVFVVLLVVGLLGWSWANNTVNSRAEAQANACTEGDSTMSVVVTPTAQKPVEAAANRWNQANTVVHAHCVHIEVRAIPSQQVLDALTGKADLATIGGLPAAWVPENSYWVDQLQTTKPGMIGAPAESVANAPSADYPFLGLAGATVDEVQARAAQVFRDYLREPAQQADFKAAGLTSG